MKIKSLKDAPTPNKLGIPSRTWIGAAFSVLYVGLLISLLFWRSKDIAALELNLLGDFVAGAVGPMAFLWLVLGYLQQGDELKQNTEALKLQADELANSVEQQRKLVELTRQQIEEERRRARLEIARHKKASKPKFLTKILDFQIEDSGDLHLDISLKNVGAPCSHVRVRSGVQSVSAQLSPTDSESQNRTIVVLSRGPNPLESADIFISYLDSAGGTGTQSIWINSYTDEDGPHFTVGGEDDSRVWEHALSAARD